MDRFLEHTRIWYFENACQARVYVTSADWMPRNFFRRIEVAFPIEDGLIVDRLVREILGLALADNTRAHILGTDGSYRRVRVGPQESRHRSQAAFMRLANVGELGVGAARENRRSRYPKVKKAPRPWPLGPKGGAK